MLLVEMYGTVIEQYLVFTKTSIFYKMHSISIYVKLILKALLTGKTICFI